MFGLFDNNFYTVCVMFIELILFSQCNLNKLGEFTEIMQQVVSLNLVRESDRSITSNYSHFKQGWQRKLRGVNLRVNYA